MKSKPFASKLEAFHLEILKLHKLGASLDKILLWLKQTKGLEVGKTTLFSFIKRRTDKRTRAKYISIESLDIRLREHEEKITESKEPIKKPSVSPKKNAEESISSTDIFDILTNHK